MAVSTQVFGIPNCDTMKKARKWLGDNAKEYHFHDYRKDGISQEWIEQAEAAIGWESMLNKRGTTFRQLSAEQKDTLNKENALALMLEMPALIKRPILLHNKHYHIGFKPDQYASIFEV